MNGCVFLKHLNFFFSYNQGINPINKEFQVDHLLQNKYNYHFYYNVHKIKLHLFFIHLWLLHTWLVKNAYGSFHL